MKIIALLFTLVAPAAAECADRAPWCAHVLETMGDYCDPGIQWYCSETCRGRGQCDAPFSQEMRRGCSPPGDCFASKRSSTPVCQACLNAGDDFCIAEAKCIPRGEALCFDAVDHITGDPEFADDMILMDCPAGHHSNSTLYRMPTPYPTAYPTKDNSSKYGDLDMMVHDPNVNEKDQMNFGSMCSFEMDGSRFSKPVGWVGAGPGKEFCNIWKCEPGCGTEFSEGNDTGCNGPSARSHFSKQKRVCSIEEKGTSFCSHTTCTFTTNPQSKGKNVIMVHSDHREQVGGYHKCGFARHGFQGGNTENGNEMAHHLQYTWEHSTDRSSDPHAAEGERTAGRPACDCICFGLDDTGGTKYGPNVPENLRINGARRQDVPNFSRVLFSDRIVGNVASECQACLNGGEDFCIETGKCVGYESADCRTPEDYVTKSEHFHQQYPVLRSCPGGVDPLDRTLDHSGFDQHLNKNNFYSSHHNADPYSATEARPLGETPTEWNKLAGTHTTNAHKHQYLEDTEGARHGEWGMQDTPYMNGQLVAHEHVDGPNSGNPYDKSHENAYKSAKLMNPLN